MARRLFFSFHYEKEIWRVNQVRNSWMTKQAHSGPGFRDASLWEEAKTKDESSSWMRMIDSALAAASVTVVLIGSETARRK